jgi:hypothetical protein
VLLHSSAWRCTHAAAWLLLRAAALRRRPHASRRPAASPHNNPAAHPMADRHGPAARRVQTLFHHVLGGDDDGRGVGPLARVPTAGMLASGAPAVTPADVPALTRLLDHDNHDMRDAMKRFMKADLFMPVRRLQRARRGPESLSNALRESVCVVSLSRSFAAA